MEKERQEILRHILDLSLGLTKKASVARFQADKMEKQSFYK